MIRSYIIFKTIKDTKFYSEIGKKGIKIRWKKFYSNVKIPTKLTKEKAAIHAYLCGDGNICIREEKTNKRKHYEIRFFPDNLRMLKNIDNCLLKCYGVPLKNIKRIGKMYSARLVNKKVCIDLLQLGKYGTYN